MTRTLPTIAVLLVILMPSSSRADPIAVPTDVFDAYPAQTLGLPTNGSVAFFGANVPDISFVRTLSDGSELVLDHQQIASANAGIYLVTAGALTVGEPLVISSRCTSVCGFSATWNVDPYVDDSAPNFGDGPIDTSVIPIRDELGLGVAAFSVNVVLPDVSDDSGPVLVLVEGASVAGHVVASEGTAQAAVHSPGGDARSECYRVRAIDAGGNEAARDDEVCVDLDPAEGGSCASTHAAAPLALLSLLTLLTLRRRSLR